jgi:hypothetical protein
MEFLLSRQSFKAAMRLFTALSQKNYFLINFLQANMAGSFDVLFACSII